MPQHSTAWARPRSRGNARDPVLEEPSMSSPSRLAAAMIALALLLGPAPGRAADEPPAPNPAPAPAPNGLPGWIHAQALAEFGTPQLPAGFRHFDYADPAAPKGGTVVLAEQG